MIQPEEQPLHKTKFLSYESSIYEFEFIKI